MPSSVPGRVERETEDARGEADADARCRHVLLHVEEMMTTRTLDGLGYAAEEIASGGGAGGETLSRGFVGGGAGGDGGEGIRIAEEP